MRKRQRPGQPVLEDRTYLWFRNWIALKRGGYHYEWRIARLVAGQVEVYGPVLTLDADNRYLHRVIWGPAIIPPSVEGTEELALNLVQGRHRSRPHRRGTGEVPEKFLAVASRITTAFVETSDDLRALYPTSPERLEEVIRRVAVLIQEATE